MASNEDTTCRSYKGLDITGVRCPYDHGEGGVQFESRILDALVTRTGRAVYISGGPRRQLQQLRVSSNPAGSLLLGTSPN